jgi:hypothetical protein
MHQIMTRRFTLYAYVYSRDGVASVLDRGGQIEMRETERRDVSVVLSLAARKSGERLEIRGDHAFRHLALKQWVSEFNAQNGKPLPLSLPEQQRNVGYGQYVSIPEQQSKLVESVSPGNRKIRKPGNRPG